MEGEGLIERFHSEAARAYLTAFDRSNGAP